MRTVRHMKYGYALAFALGCVVTALAYVLPVVHAAREEWM